MTVSRSIAGFLICVTGLACQPRPDQPLTSDEQRTIAETVENLFDEIATATNDLEFDRLLQFYRRSDDLTYVARGRISRSYATFAELLNAQFGAVTGAELRFLEKTVDVVSRDVVVVTALFQFAATLDTGETGRSSGTFMCIYVLRDARWEIQYSSHTFPADGQ